MVATLKNDSSAFNGSKSKTALASEKEIVDLLINVYFLALNGLLMNKSTPLHSLVDFQLSLYSYDDIIDVNASVSHAFGNQFLSKTHCSCSSYGTWEFIHSLNAVSAEEDIHLLKSKSFFPC